MPYLVQASFCTAVQDGITADEVREALKPLLDGFSCSFRERSSFDRSRQCWFDGVEVGVEVADHVSHDFQEAFNQAADAVAQLSADAFETTHINDNTMTDRETTRVVGPDAASIGRFRTRQELDAFAEAARKLPLPKVVGSEATLRLCDATELSLVSEEGPADALLVASLNLGGVKLTADQRKLVLQQFETLSRMLNSFTEQKLGLTETRYAPAAVMLSHEDLARMAIGPGGWQASSGPETGRGDERWFSEKSGAWAYTCIEQGKLVALEVRAAGGRLSRRAGGGSATHLLDWPGPAAAERRLMATDAHTNWLLRSEALVTALCDASHLCGAWTGSDGTSYDDVFRAAEAARAALRAHLAEAPVTRASDLLSDVSLLEISRATGLRRFLHGVNATDAKPILRAYVDAVEEAAAGFHPQATDAEPAPAPAAIQHERQR